MRYALLVFVQFGIWLPIFGGSASHPDAHLDDLAVRVSQGERAALQELRSVAKQDNPAAQYYLGAIYLQGFGVPADKSEASHWFQKAAKAGLVDAYYAMAKIQQEEAVVAWANAGPEGCWICRGNRLVAAAIQGGNVLPARIPDKIMEFRAQIIERMRKIAAFEPSGEIYKVQLGQSEHEIEELEKRSAQGDREAQYRLAMIYEGMIAYTHDTKSPAEWLMKSATAEYPDAQYKIGAMLMLGSSYIEQDIPTGVEWIKKAASQGFAPAQAQLGQMYLYGVGIKQDTPSARQWFEAAAEQWDSKGLVGLGKLSELSGQSPDRTRTAAKWYWLASQHDYYQAPVFLYGLAANASLDDIKSGRADADTWTSHWQITASQLAHQRLEQLILRENACVLKRVKRNESGFTASCPCCCVDPFGGWHR